MWYVIIDRRIGNHYELGMVQGESKAEAAAEYASQHLPWDARAQQYRLRVLELDQATDFNALATRHEDHIESIAKEIPPDSQFRKEATDAHQP